MADNQTSVEGRQRDIEFFEGLPSVSDRTEPFESFDDLPTVEPSFLEKATAFGRTATGALAEGIPTLVGTAVGGAAGSVAGPVGTAAGATAGFEAGRRAGEGLRELLTETPSPTNPDVTLAVPGPEALPPELRPFGVAGEAVGTGSTIAGAPLAAARVGAQLPGTNVVGRFINRIVDTARRSPGLFASTEAAGVAGGGVGAGVAEAAFPGQPGPAFVGEVAGGFFNPVRTILSATRGTADIVRRAFETMSRTGQESRAGRLLRDILQESGEDPEVLAEMLNAADISGAGAPPLTAAQATGSPGLAAVEAMLRRNSAEFDKESRDRALAGLEFMQNAVRTLQATGDPQALRAAAEIRNNVFRSMIAQRVQTAEQQALDAARRLRADTPAARAELGRQAQEAVETSLREVRGVERELWEQVDRDIPAEVSNLVDQFDEIRADLLPEESMPPIIEGFMRRVRDEPEADLPEDVQQLIQQTFGDLPSVGRPGEPPTTSGELLRFRSRALDLAREAQANNRFNDARIFGLMAEAALDDLTAIGARGGGALDEARTFSRELHDTFTRTFADQATATSRSGARRVAPELFLNRAFASGSDAANLRMQEIEDATRFLARRGLDTPISAQNLQTVLDAQERILRIAAAQSLDPNTGRVSATRLGNFLRDNEALLNRFPEVRTEITNALNTETGAQAAARLATGATRAVDQQAAFARLVGFENPVDAVGDAINSRNPVKEMLALTRFATRAGVDAQEGLRASVLDFAMEQASGAGGRFDFDRLQSALFDPIRSGQPSLAEIMQRSRVFRKQDIDRLQNLINRAGDITDAIGQGASMDQLMENPDGLLDLVLRIGGARLGAEGAVGAASGSSLVAAGAGSRFLRNAFDAVPQAKVKNILIEAAKDPRFAALLLRNATSNADRITLGRQLHAYLINAGLTALPGEEEDFDMRGQFSPGTNAGNPVENNELLPVAPQ